MTPAQEQELFAQLRGLPRFADWLDAVEAEAVAVLKVNHELVVLNQAQGKAQLVDRMRKMLVSAHTR